MLGGRLPRVAGQRHTRRRWLAPGADLPPLVQFVAAFDTDGQLAQGATDFFLLALELVKFVRGIQRGDDAV